MGAFRREQGHPRDASGSARQAAGEHGRDGAELSNRNNRSRERKMARPTKLDDLVSKRIVTAIAKGLPRDTAAKLAGVAPSTLYLWLRKGAEGERPYSEFSCTLKKAEAEGEAELVAVIREAGKSSWQACAWLLERRRPQRWALRRERERDKPMTKAEADRLVAEAGALAWAPEGTTHERIAIAESVVAALKSGL